MSGPEPPSPAPEVPPEAAPRGPPRATGGGPLRDILRSAASAGVTGAPAPASHRFSLPLFFGMLAAFAAIFGAELVADLHLAAARAGRPLAEVWPGVQGSWLMATQAGGTLARAGYSMLAVCLSAFLLSIPFAATFYTPKLSEMFLADRTNRAIFTLGVVASASTHFQTTASWEPFYDGIALWVNVALIAVAWAAILPYAFYAFRFLSPAVLVARLEAALVRDLAAAARPGPGDAAIERIALRVRQGVLDLSNLALRAVDRSDRDLTLDVVRALARSYQAFVAVKAALPPAWFRPRPDWFEGLADEAVDLIERDRTWVSHLLLHQMWLVYFTALGKMPDAAPAVASLASRVAFEGARREHWALVELGVRFSNTFIREAVKRAEPRILRAVARARRDLVARLDALPGERPRRVVAQAADHLRYYIALAREAGGHEAAEALERPMERLAIEAD